ncbi:MAG: hypothetical protein GY884_33880 [Proteobacteria bacterium]|nr:hypothetical protein [Pseudomonadota bacterium]
MRPQIVVLSKSDLLGPDELQERQRALEAAAACPVVVISAATQTGLRPLLHRMWALVQTRRAEQAPSTESENC